jgi:hypothetical protein
VLAIANYGMMRQKARMELVADTLISTIKQQQNLAKSGKGEKLPDGSEILLCYGMSFDVDNSVIKLITAPYVSISIGTEFADYCDISDKNKVTKNDFAALENFKLLGVDVFNDPTKKTYVIMFRPPEANISIGDSLDNLSILQKPGTTFTNSEISFTLESPDKIEQRKISFDVATGRLTKTNPQTAAADEKK